MELIKSSKARLEKNKLIIEDNITLDEWKELGMALKQVEGSVQFWIGDWARFGEKKGFTGKYVSPKVYDELEDITGLSRDTLHDYKSVASNVDSSLRNEHLSFNHHKTVAPLDPEQQEYFLNKASEEKLSVRKLREEIKDTWEESRQNVVAATKLIAKAKIEDELIELAKEINKKYNKEQRLFLIDHIK